MTLTSKIILHMTFWGIALGAILLFLIDPVIAGLPPSERLLAAGFQSMTALTTVGFNTHPIGAMGMAALLVVVILMVMGASPSGTGGGIKSTSVSAALAVLWSVLRQRPRVTFFGKVVPAHRLFAAFASIAFYINVLLAGSILLLLVQSQPFEDVIFEAASAIGTVGLSRGITADLTPLGKIIVIALMFIGRLGPLTFGLAVFVRNHVSEPAGDRTDDLAV